jgi:hypothetical protein
MTRAAPLVLALCCSVAGAQSVSDVAKAIETARREIIVALPIVGRNDIAASLKAAAARGTRVFLITEARAVTSGGYLLNVSHGPKSINTYLYASRIPTPWIMVDGAWVASGDQLDTRSGAALTVTRDPAVLQRLNTWATQITKRGPIPRVELLKLRYRSPRQDAR